MRKLQRCRQHAWKKWKVVLVHQINPLLEGGRKVEGQAMSILGKIEEVSRLSFDRSALACACTCEVVKSLKSDDWKLLPFFGVIVLFLFAHILLHTPPAVVGRVTFVKC